MAKRLRKTTADYLAIAVSPALIIALVGSLVFFLIEVLYVGRYQGRLNYVFALFVFAAVLVARIAIEMGAARAAMFSLPLGLATFLVLMRFVEHDGPFSSLINLALIAVVWWCAHKLTWDCTLIDDDEDASGAGLMQHLGVDESAGGENTVDDDESPISKDARTRPHAPGLWVLYFSLAALPLFGLGQQWIPVAETGRRQYAFALLLVYVASALLLLVTTSFLGLRRYLRQRRLEMPTPMAATWVVSGLVVVLLVMFVAALVPRPHAEYAISQVPWQAHSPGGLSASRVQVGSDGSDDRNASGQAQSQKQEDPQDRGTQNDRSPRANGNGKRENRQPENGNQAGGQRGKRQQSAGQGNSQQASSQAQQSQAQQNQSSQQSSQQGQRQNGSQDGRRQPAQEPSSEQSQNKQQDQRQPSEPSNSTQQGQQSSEKERNQQLQSRSENNHQAGNETRPMRFAHTNRPQAPKAPRPPDLVQNVWNSFGGMVGLVKWLFYAALVVLVAYLAWKNREQIFTALAEIAQNLREFWARLFRRSAADTPAVEHESMTEAGPPLRTFVEFQDPFVQGRDRQLPPDELVRYTFEAFEAWARDHGHRRSPDQTPQELVREALPARTPLFEAARQLARLYGEAAYASSMVSRRDVQVLRKLWSAMRSETR